MIFYNKAVEEIALISENQNYRNAILTNIIQKNIEIIGLIDFYKNAVNSKQDNTTENLSRHFQTITLLHELLVFGKILEFKYAQEYNKEILLLLKSELERMDNELKAFYLEYLDNVASQKDSIKYTWLDKKWLLGNMVGSRKQKDKRKEDLDNSSQLIEVKHHEREQLIQDQLDTLFNFIEAIEQPQEYLLEAGLVYKLERAWTRQRPTK